METSPEFSLIFVNYRSARYLSMALRSLFASEIGSSFEVIVVNNDSQEERILTSLQRFFPFRLIQSGDNSGFGAGNNLGARVARGGIIGFVNPDTFWEDGKLEDIKKLFLEDFGMGVLGLRLVDENGDHEAWSAGSLPTLSRIVLNNIPLVETFRRVSEGAAVEWVSGGALFVRRELFRELGGFDDRFFLYFEDADLCARAREAGYAVRLDPEIFLKHYGGKSHRSKKRQKNDFFRSQDLYFQKHRPVWEYFSLRFLRFLRYGR